MRTHGKYLDILEQLRESRKEGEAKELLFTLMTLSPCEEVLGDMRVVLPESAARRSVEVQTIAEACLFIWLAKVGKVIGLHFVGPDEAIRLSRSAFDCLENPTDLPTAVCLALANAISLFSRNLEYRNDSWIAVHEQLRNEVLPLITALGALHYEAQSATACLIKEQISQRKSITVEELNAVCELLLSAPKGSDALKTLTDLISSIKISAGANMPHEDTLSAAALAGIRRHFEDEGTMTFLLQRDAPAPVRLVPSLIALLNGRGRAQALSILSQRRPPDCTAMIGWLHGDKGNVSIERGAVDALSIVRHFAYYGGHASEVVPQLARLLPAVCAPNLAEPVHTESVVSLTCQSHAIPLYEKELVGWCIELFLKLIVKMVDPSSVRHILRILGMSLAKVQDIEKPVRLIDRCFSELTTEGERLAWLFELIDFFAEKGAFGHCKTLTDAAVLKDPEVTWKRLLASSCPQLISSALDIFTRSGEMSEARLQEVGRILRERETRGKQ